MLLPLLCDLPDGIDDADFVLEATVEVVRAMLGSARYHHQGIKTGPVPNTLRVRVS